MPSIYEAVFFFMSFFVFSQLFRVDSGIVLPVLFFVSNCKYFAGSNWPSLPLCCGSNSCGLDTWDLDLRIYLYLSALDLVYFYFIYLVLLFDVLGFKFFFSPSVQKCTLHFGNLSFDVHLQ